MAPEVIQRRQYGKPGDVWSAGVLLHVLLTGTLPFVGSRDRLREAICRGRVQMETSLWDPISEPAKDLIQRMLTTDVNHRITIQEVLNHKWLRDRDKGAARIHLGDTIEELKKFNARRKLKDAVKAAVSSSKWHAPYSEANGDNFSDVGDDEITTGAVAEIADCLDDIEILEESDRLLRSEVLNAVDDHRIRVILELMFIGDAELAGDLLEIAGFLLYDRISGRVPAPYRAPQTDAVQRARDVEEILREAEHSAVRNIDRADLRELHELLIQPHMRFEIALLRQAVIAKSIVGRYGLRHVCNNPRVNQARLDSYYITNQ
ncbi:CSKP protein, partial [Pseudoatta argentina]